MPPTPPLAALVRRLTPDADAVPDADLLDRFVRSDDQAAFELLVWRHGAMVWGTCRRILDPDRDAAEDACQAAFVALAAHAGRVRDRQAVAAWLHRVAVRASLDLLAARRGLRPLPSDRPDPPAADPEPGQVAADREVRALLDAGLNRLPDKLRIPFVMCELEGRSNAAAAAELGCPVGTVESRLVRARQRLRGWLTARGVTPAAIGVAVAVPDTVLAAMTLPGVPGAQVGPRIRALAARAVGSSVGAKVRVVVAVGLVLTVSAVGHGLTRESVARPANLPPAQENPKQPVAQLPDPAAAVRAKLIGRWQVESGARGTRPLTDWDKQGFVLDFDPSGALTIRRGQIRDQRAFTWVIDGAAGVPKLVLTPKGGTPTGAIPLTLEVVRDSLDLTWAEPPGLSRGAAREPTACHLTLSRITVATGEGLAVAPASQHTAGASLAGTWESDDELNRRLGRPVGMRKSRLTFAPDPSATREIPEAYRELFAGKRIYLAGRMEVAGEGGQPTSLPFFLIELHGSPLLVYFVPDPNDDRACEEAVAVALVQGANRDRDLLFLSPFETARRVPVGGFRRITGGK